MAESLQALGLQHNADYEGQGVEIKHADKGWHPLVRTSLKMAFYTDGQGKERRMSLAKLEDARGVERAEPETKEEKEPEQSRLAMGLFTNTDYSGDEIEVHHKKEDLWYPLVRTSNQVLYIDKGGENPNRMTLAMLDGVRGLEEAGEEVDLSDGTEDEAPEGGTFGEEYMDTEFSQPMQDEVGGEEAAV